MTQRHLLSALFACAALACSASTEVTNDPVKPVRPPPRLVAIDDDRDPRVPDDGDELPPHDGPAYRAPADGFRWSVPRRFGDRKPGTSLVDFHWDEGTMTYDDAYVHPDGFPATFVGCRTAEEYAANASITSRYRWVFDASGAAPVVVEDGRCRLSLEFPEQGSYDVELTVTPVAGGDPVTTRRAIRIRDLLIVSLGDSYASGEGNPDLFQQYHANPWPIPGWSLDAPPVWQDRRCHRSAWAGPAQAALAIENADPHTSVTFLSFACSGATVGTPSYNDQPAWFETLYEGVGVLEPYAGAEHDDGDPWIPSQMDQLVGAVGTRHVDALILSGGGNDVHFGPVAQECLFEDGCWTNPQAYAYEAPRQLTGVNLSYFQIAELVDRALAKTEQYPSYNLPADFGRFAEELVTRSLDVAEVYVTEYPDPTHDTDGSACQMLEDILAPLTYELSPTEAIGAKDHLLVPLNQAVHDAADRYGWVYVGGVMRAFDASTGVGHGYCASDNWIRRAEEAELIQGPLNNRAGTKGTLHPSISGHAAYREAILRELVPRLGLDADRGPTFLPATFASADGYANVVEDGWVTKACNAAGACRDEAYLTVSATHPTGITGVSASVNGEACPAGVRCGAPVVSDDGHTVTWSFAFDANGTYSVRLGARDGEDRYATFARDLRVRFGPPPPPPIGPFTVPEGGAVVLDAGAAGTATAWDLDGDGTFETAGATATFSAATLDGPSVRTIFVRIASGAGEFVTSGVVQVTNVAPTLALAPEGAPTPAGAPVSVSGTFTDPGVPDTHACTVSWDDGGPASAGTVVEPATGAPGTCTATRSFGGAGVYTAAVTVSDDDGATDTQTVRIVVYDAGAGAVTGGGWFESLSDGSGELASRPVKANFGFTARYLRGASAPTGQVEVQVHGRFRFHADAFAWLVVAGARAQLEGAGELDGQPGYDFLLTVADGEAAGDLDRVRFRVWDRATGAVVYDSVPGAPVDLDAADPQPIAAGSVVVHAVD